MANILIVEDEKNMQNIIAEYMQRGGHTCFLYLYPLPIHTHHSSIPMPVEWHHDNFFRL